MNFKHKTVNHKQYTANLSAKYLAGMYWESNSQINDKSDITKSIFNNMINEVSDIEDTMKKLNNRSTHELG